MLSIKRKLQIGLVAACVGAFLLVGTASAATVDQFSLDSYHAWNKNHTPAVKSEVKLKDQHLYVATVSGTFSYYGALNYLVPQSPWTVVCGTPEAAPQYGSAGGSGEVGFDAEYIFARPWTEDACAQAHLPVRWTNFQMNDGDGVWAHPTALSQPTPPAPSASHAYDYAIVGQKSRVAFRLFDIRTRDNYGTLRISIRTATASDCAGTNYEAFGTDSEASCIAAL
jgi:hypothetical protein